MSPCPGELIPRKTSWASTPAKATLSSRTMATITTAAGTISSYNASPGGAFGAPGEKVGGAARSHFALRGPVRSPSSLSRVGSSLARVWSVPARDWRAAVSAVPAKAASSQLSLVLAAAVFVLVATRR